MQRTVAIIAPATLDEFYTFTATVDGKIFTVTVPEGGVQEGDLFEVSYPDDTKKREEIITVVPGRSVVQQKVSSGDTSTAIVVSNAASAISPVPQFLPVKLDPNHEIRFRWRTSLSSCCQTCCCPFWIGLCCMGILLGQVMQRFKLDACGVPGNHEQTCIILTTISIGCNIIIFCLGEITVPSFIVYYAMMVYFITAITFTRLAFRKRYEIPGSCCGDCCCAVFCGSCVVCQMHQHTHDESKYPYECASKTGLGRNAPEVV